MTMRRTPVPFCSVMFAMILVGVSVSDVQSAECVTKESRTLPGNIERHVMSQVKIASERAPLIGLSPVPVYAGVFAEVSNYNPELTEEQLFEVASMLGNASEMNAKYYMLYLDNEQTETVVISNPGFDFRDTSGNICDP